MISISNQDRDKAVEYIRAYAASIDERKTHSTVEYNKKRMALNLAAKLERKHAEALPGKAQNNAKK
jgi:hypothetical protein